MATIAERVARGVKYMDEFAPADWRERIDLDLLDISNGSDCIFGQVFRGDSSCCGWCAHGDDFESNSDGGEARDYGFDGSWDDCDALNAEWQSVLSV